MAWWEGANETRVLIAQGPSTSGKHVGDFLSLRHPRTGNTMCYLYGDEVLQELHWFKQSYGSWFLGDYVCEDGCLYTATPVDPIFVLLPIFEEARMKKGDDPGKFRQLDEIMYIPRYPGYQSLSSIAQKTMQVVCDVKVIDAVSIVGEYLKDEPWVNLLCDKLKLNLQDRTNAQDTEMLPASLGNGPASFNPVQESNGIDKKTGRTARQTKKAKVEKDSQNIKDMFSRATRKKG